MNALPWRNAAASLFGLVAANAVCHAQVIPDHPRWDVTPEVLGWTMFSQATVTPVSGPAVPHALFQLHPRFGLSFNYRNPNGWGMTIGVAAVQTPASYGFDLALATDTTGRSVWNAGEYKIRSTGQSRFEVTLSTHHLIWKHRRWFLLAVAGIRPTYISEFHVGASAGEPIDGQFVDYFRLAGPTASGWHVAGAAALEAHYMFNNFNRIILRVEWCYAPFVVWSGDYVLARNTDQESRGTFEQRGSYWGFNLGYSLSWGAPKEPRWYRKQAREAQKQPAAP